MPQRGKPHQIIKPLVSDLFLRALKKLKSNEVGTFSSPKAASGPLYSEWQSSGQCLDLPDLSALFRLSLVLPDCIETLVETLFKPASLTIIQVPDEHLLSSCEKALSQGYLPLACSEFDYLPTARLIGADGRAVGSRFASRAKQGANDIPSSLVSQTPTILLVVDHQHLPQTVVSAATNMFSLPPLSQDEVNVLFRQARGISLKAVLPKLLSDLPCDEILSSLPLEEVYAALHQSNSTDVADALWSSVNAKKIKEDENALDQVIGLGPSRAQLEQLAQDLVDWKTGQLPWADMTRGLLLYGKPGVGKTFCAQKLAQLSGAHLVTASYAEWQRHGHLGDLLDAMTKSFKEARECAPSILFLDEIDAFGDRKTAAGDNAHYTRTVINALLEQLDGIGKQEGVLIVGACNFPEYLDEALVRSGRFDLKIEMPLPDKASLVELLKLHLGPDADTDLLPSLASSLIGSSGADIAALVRKARAFARQSKRDFSAVDLEDIVCTSISSLSENNLRRAALHEAGHAIVGFVTGKGQPLRAWVGPNGGEVSFTDPDPLPEISKLEAEIATALAGRASEEINYTRPCAGSGGTEDSDLAKATKLAVAIETAYGLGSSGLTWRPSPTESYAELLANRDLAERVEMRLQAALNTAKSIIVEQKHLVEILASKLVDQRELSAAELMNVLKPTEVKTGPMFQEGSCSPQVSPSHMPQAEMSG